MEYKCLLEGRRSPHTRLEWPVRAGAWTPAREPVLCKSGWHLATVEGLSEHLVAGELWEAEGRGKYEVAVDKVAYSQARLVRKVGDVSVRQLRELACDFAEHVLHLWETRYPDDLRPRQAIEVARRYARGEAMREELDDAACAARGAASGAAAYAGAAAYYAAASDAYATAAAAGAAAYYAAARTDAAFDARDAERRWQGARILEVVG